MGATAAADAAEPKAPDTSPALAVSRESFPDLPSLCRNCKTRPSAAEAALILDNLRRD
jgi:hypothetical protein